jgi:hexokinase
MNLVKKRVDAFLRSYGMHYKDINMDECCSQFIDEMEKGLGGEDSSLAMLPAYIGPGGDISTDEPVVIIDAGGTNFRVAAAHFDKNRQFIMEDYKKYAMPGTREEITREAFFESIAEYLEPVINKSDKIGFCFSYASEILPNRDARLIFFSKEIKVRGMEGEEVGSALLKTLKERGVRGEKKITLLNDTVAALLGGKAQYPDRKFSSYIGFIFGTGMNTAYVEENKNICKTPDIRVKPGYTIVNTESGGYGRAPRGEIDEKLDLDTKEPGRQKLEKMISGAYQGTLLLEVLRKAAGDGLFSGEFIHNIGQVKNIEPREIDEFCQYPFSDKNILGRCIGVGDSRAQKEGRMTLYYIIDAIFERAAKFAAVNIASILLKTGEGKDPCEPVCVTAEGTTFNKSIFFRPKLDYYIKDYLSDKKGIYCEFIKNSNTTMIGTAIAGLIP